MMDRIRHEVLDDLFARLPQTRFLSLGRRRQPTDIPQRCFTTTARAFASSHWAGFPPRPGSERLAVLCILDNLQRRIEVKVPHRRGERRILDSQRHAQQLLIGLNEVRAFGIIIFE